MNVEQVIRLFNWKSLLELFKSSSKTYVIFIVFVSHFQTCTNLLGGKQSRIFCSTSCLAKIIWWLNNQTFFLWSKVLNGNVWFTSYTSNMGTWEVAECSGVLDDGVWSFEFRFILVPWEIKVFILIFSSFSLIFSESIRDK